MLLGSALSLVSSITLMASVLALHFGSYTAAYYILRKVLDRKMTFSKFIQDELLDMTTNNFVVLAFSAILLIVAVGLFFAVVLPIYATYIINVLIVFSFVSFGISLGSIIVFRKDTGGTIPLRGLPATIVGWGIILLSLTCLIFILKNL